MKKYTFSFVGSNGKRVNGGGGFETKTKAESDLRKIKSHERKTFGKVMTITKSIRIIKL